MAQRLPWHPSPFDCPLVRWASRFSEKGICMKRHGCPIALLVASALWTGSSAIADEPGHLPVGPANAPSHAAAADEHKSGDHEEREHGTEDHAEGQYHE